MFIRGITMKKLLEVLRLHFDNELSQRQIAKVTGLSNSTISQYIKMFTNGGLSWPLEEQYLDEKILSKMLNPNYRVDSNSIDFLHINKELRHTKNLTLQLIWDEMQAENKLPYSYSHFALLYRKWLGKQPSYMRQTHKPGDKVFVDYSGDKLKIIDTDTGELRTVEIFVGVLGASELMYIEATWTQQVCNWTMSHVRMFEYFGGVPHLVVPDNLKSGVIHPDRYDPKLNQTYSNMLAYYGSAALPARVRMPKDKALAENGVRLAQRWVLARLRHEQIYGLAACNERLRELMEFANKKQFKQYPESRRELFEQFDQPYLRPLPKYPYVYRDYKKVRVLGDYHIEIQKHYYSVPYNLIQKEIDVWYNDSIVECYHNNICVAKHIRSNKVREKTTCNEHMPNNHKKYAELTPDKMLEWAKSIGEATLKFVESILKSAIHKDIGCRKSNGFLNLSRKYSNNQLESACIYAINNNITTSDYIEAIIKQQIEQLVQSPIIHENIRGSEYYN